MKTYWEPRKLLLHKTGCADVIMPENLCSFVVITRKVDVFIFCSSQLTFIEYLANMLHEFRISMVTSEP